MILRATAFFLLLGLAACEGTQIGAREKGAAGGAAIGAGLGAIVGHQTGRAGEGVAIGSAIGALSGALIGHGIDQQDAELSERDRRIAEQERVLEENRRLIEELRARGTDVRMTDRGVVVNLPDVLFEFDSFELRHEAHRTAGEIARVLQSVQSRVISVEGHTDSIGSAAYNQRLSEERARSVADALAANGVSRNNLRTRGLGKDDPIASNSTAEGRRRNRRVEVVVENN